MGLLDKLFGGARKVPAWADVLEPGEYELFASQLSQALRARSLPANLRSGSITVTVDGERASFSFANLAKRCKAAEQSRWPALIAEHLAVAVESTAGVLASFEKNFEQALVHMRVQLVPDGFVRADWAEGLNYKTFGAGIKSALVYDLPNSVITVPAGHLRGWRKSFVDLLDAASRLAREDSGTLVAEPVELAEARLTLHQLIGESYFVCSHALWLEQYREAQSERGVLLGVPTRHTVVFHSIRDASAWRALSALPTFIERLGAALPGPVSSNVFWLRNGRVVDVPTASTASGTRVMPPESLVAVMGELGEA